MAYSIRQHPEATASVFRTV